MTAGVPIASVSARLFRVPLDEVLVDAMHGEHAHFELVTATIELEDGSVGTGYTYTGGRGGHAIHAVVSHDLTPALIGRDATPVEDLNDLLDAHIHYVGRGGIATSQSQRSTSRCGISAAGATTSPCGDTSEGAPPPPRHTTEGSISPSR